MKNNFIKSILPQNSSDAPQFFDDVYKKGIQRKKLQADGLNSGRSMVEMLGVLAIIGVLSAGALKGYSAAMFKYKMNQTIDEATKIFQRFEELNQKDWGGTEEEPAGIWTGDDSAVQWGLLEKCDFDGTDSCRLPQGTVFIELFGHSLEHFGLIQFNFTNAKSCTAFASVHWEQMLPQEWWYPEGLITINGKKATDIYCPYRNKTTPLTTSQIAEGCQKACIEGSCNIAFVYRAY